MKIVVAGCTGLIGRNISLKLDKSGDDVYLLSRRPIDPYAPQQSVLVTDFKDIRLPASTSRSDIVLCALGTTIKTAGSKEAFAEVDLHTVLRLAKAAKQAGYSRFSVVSSLGTREDTSNFYLKTKSSMERGLKDIGFESLSIFRPSLLLGDRDEFRLGEKVGEYVSAVLTPIMIGKLRRFRPIQASTVATAMVNIARQETTGVATYESEQIRTLAAQ